MSAMQEKSSRVFKEGTEKNKGRREVPILPVAIPWLMPTYDNRIHSEILLQYDHMIKQNIYLFPVISQASNIPRGRNGLMTYVLKTWIASSKRDGYIFLLWQDTDIFIQPKDYPHFIDMLRYAYGKENNTIVACYYKQSDGNLSIRKHRHTLDENEYLEISSKEEYIYMGQKGITGFGLCAGWFPMNYKFHADTLGEDTNFYLDTHPELFIVNSFHPVHSKIVNMW